MDESAASSTRRSWIGRVGGFFALAGLYRLLVGPDDPVDWMAGVVASALAMAGVAAVSGQLPASTIRPAWAFKILRLVPRIFAEAARVAWSALAIDMPAGTFEIVPVDPGGDDAESTGRRGLVIAGASLAPNGVVVTLDRDHRAMLVHRLLKTRSRQGSNDPEWPS